VYATRGLAAAAADYIQQARGTALKVYECPFRHGWHLTKSGAGAIWEDNGLHDAALPSKGDMWELAADDDSGALGEGGGTIRKPKRRQEDPIVKMECKRDTEHRALEGRVIEVIKNVAIEKRFGINLNNPLCAGFVKNVFDRPVDQITLYVRRDKHIHSYTFFTKHANCKKDIRKGDLLQVNVCGKTIYNRTVWYADRVGK
jgi:hypothetical protein